MAHRGDHLRQRRSVLNMDEVTLNSWNSIAPTTRTAGQGGTAVTRFWGKLPMLAAALVITIAYTYAADTPLLEPHNLIVDRSLPREQADTQIIAAQRSDNFWNNGEEALTREAIAPNFVDKRRPTGRTHGVD